MNKIIVFFYLFLLGFIESRMNFEVKFEVQHFENNITISEVYYSDIDDDIFNFKRSFKQDKIAILLSEWRQFECVIAVNTHEFYYIYSNTPKKRIFYIYDCLNYLYLYPTLRLFDSVGKIIQISNDEISYIIHRFIEQFSLYTKFEKINQKIKKYQINIDDLF
jgi:hypothetical protein